MDLISNENIGSADFTAFLNHDIYRALVPALLLRCQINSPHSHSQLQLGPQGRQRTHLNSCTEYVLKAKCI